MQYSITRFYTGMLLASMVSKFPEKPIDSMQEVLDRSKLATVSLNLIQTFFVMILHYSTIPAQMETFKFLDHIMDTIVKLSTPTGALKLF